MRRRNNRQADFGALDYGDHDFDYDVGVLDYGDHEFDYSEDGGGGGEGDGYVDGKLNY